MSKCMGELETWQAFSAILTAWRCNFGWNALLGLCPENVSLKGDAVTGQRNTTDCIVWNATGADQTNYTTLHVQYWCAATALKRIVPGMLYRQLEHVVAAPRSFVSYTWVHNPPQSQSITRKHRNNVG